jgi:hypothetical protein
MKNPRIFQSSGRSPGTIRPLAKPFSRFILYRAGRLEQLDHSRNSSRFFYHRAGCPKQFDSFQKKKQKNQKWAVFQMTCSLCKSHMFSKFSRLKKTKTKKNLSTFFFYKFTTQSSRK